MGYNLYQRVNNFTMGVSDTAYPTLVNGNLTEEGVYKWNIDRSDRWVVMLPNKL